MKPLSYVQDILNNYDFNLVLEDKAIQFKYVLLAMVILQPPIRTSFYNSAKFMFNKSDDDNQTFFLYPKEQEPKEHNYHKP